MREKKSNNNYRLVFVLKEHIIIIIIIVHGFAYTIGVFNRLIFLITFCESTLADAEREKSAPRALHRVRHLYCIRF